MRIEVVTSKNIFFQFAEKVSPAMPTGSERFTELTAVRKALNK